MKPMVLDGSTCRRSHSRVVIILVVLVFCSCFSLTLFDSLSQAADEEAVRLESPTSNYRSEADRLLTLLGTRVDGTISAELDRMHRDPEAVGWFRQAAEQCDAVAQMMLGRMFARGSGVPKDGQEAVKWFRKAADQGNSIAQYRLGRMYEKGLGVAKDQEEALRWFGKSADQGNARAQNDIGWRYASRLWSRQGLRGSGEMVQKSS